MDYQVGQRIRDVKLSLSSIFILSGQNTIIVYDRGSLEKVDTIRSMGYDQINNLFLRGENIYTILNNHEIIEYKNHQWISIYKSKYVIYGGIYTSASQGFLITEAGIEDTLSGVVYQQPQSMNTQLNEGEKMSKPFGIFKDRRDVIWLGFNYGEWGGDVMAFDTHKKSFIDLKMNDVSLELLPVINFFENEGNVYFTSGLEHLMNYGNVVMLRDYSASEILSVRSKSFLEDNIEDVNLLGAGDYSKSEETIYIFAGRNILKGKLGDDLNDITNWERILYKPLSKENQVVKRLKVLGNNKVVYLTEKGVLYSCIDGLVTKLV